MIHTSSTENKYTTNTKLSDNLKLLSAHYSIGCRKLANATGLTYSYLAKLTKGQYTNPRLDTLKKIATFFGISIAQLTGEQKINFNSLSKKINLNKH